jgi:hypothetical protein
VTTSVICQPYVAPIVTGTSACSLSGSIPNFYLGATENYGVNASISASYTFTPTTFSTIGKANATAYSSISQFPESQANSSISVGIATVGAVRPGFVLVTFDALADKGDGEGGASETYSFDPEVNAGVGVCAGGIFSVCDYSFLEPFTLGTPFNLTETMGVEARSTSYSDQATTSAKFSLQFFEADGTTPVNIEEVPIVTPEPRSFALLFVGLMGLLGWAYRVRSTPATHPH